MTQYRITTADFYTQGETGDPDAVIDDEALALLKQQAGISGLMRNALAAVYPRTVEPTNLREVKHETTTKQVL